MRAADRARQRDREVDRQPALDADPQPAVLDGLGERAGPQAHAGVGEQTRRRRSRRPRRRRSAAGAPRSRPTARAPARARRPSGRSAAPARTAAASRRSPARPRTRRAAARRRAGARARRAAARCPPGRGTSARRGPPPRRARRARAAARRRAARSAVGAHAVRRRGRRRAAGRAAARSRGRRRSRGSEKRCGDGEAERLGDGDRAVHELVAVAEQGDVDAFAGQALDGERAFEGGGSAAGDEQVHAAASYGRRARRRHPRQRRVLDCGFPAVTTRRCPGRRRAASATEASCMPTNVLIAGGGPAALEAALALHRLAGEQVVDDAARPRVQPHATGR